MANSTHKSHSVEVAEPPILQPETPLIVSPRALPPANNIGDLIDPDAVLGTRFTGPLISGSPDDGVAGIALLHKRAKFTYQNANFSFPVRFPPSAILTLNILQLQQTWAGSTTAKLNLGTTPGGLDIISFDLTLAPSQATNNMNTILGSSWQIYATYVTTGPAPTAGKATLLIMYSVPAMVVPS